MNKFKDYKTRDWVVIAVVGAVIGALFTLMDSAYSPLESLLGPILISLTFGVYAMSALLPIYIIRKPGAALVGSLIGAVLNILTGSPYGIHIIVAGLLQGLGAEVGFAIGKYEKYSIFNFLLSGIFITIFVTLRDYFVFGLNQLTPDLLIATIVIRLASAAVIGFVLCWVLGKALKKVGLMKQSKA